MARNTLPVIFFLSFNIQKAHRRAGCRHLFTIDKLCFYFVSYNDRYKNLALSTTESSNKAVGKDVVFSWSSCCCCCWCWWCSLIASKLSECLVEFITDRLVFLLLSQKFIFQSINLLLELRHCPLSFCGTVFSILKAASKVSN